MNLLAAKLYDPAVSVSKSTAALLAMTAIDTANLRLAITVPAHGMVRFRLVAVVHGTTTFPSILLGVMNGATVIGRVAPVQSLGNTAVATAMVNVEADFIVTGLTPGALNVDAAYGVETLIAGTGLKFGGPNDTTANNAFGGFVFEAWDPQPQTANSVLAVDANGRVDVAKVAGTAQTARDLGAQLDAAVTTRLAPTVAGRTLDVTATGEAGVDWANIGGAATAQNLSGTTVKAVTDRVSANIDQVDGAALTAHAAGKLPADVLTVAGTAQTARDLGAQLDATVSSRLAAAGYSAPDNAGIAAIKAKTDSLNFTVAGKLDVNLLYVNGVQLVGTGVDGSDEWRHAP